MDFLVDLEPSSALPFRDMLTTLATYKWTKLTPISKCCIDWLSNLNYE